MQTTPAGATSGALEASGLGQDRRLLVGSTSPHVLVADGLAALVKGQFHCDDACRNRVSPSGAGVRSECGIGGGVIKGASLRDLCLPFGHIVSVVSRAPGLYRRTRFTPSFWIRREIGPDDRLGQALAAVPK